MPLTLDHLPDGIAVLHGVDTPDALTHLSRSMRAGTAFDSCRGLVVDLGGTEPDARLLAELDEAIEACLRRRQVIAFAEDEARAGAGTDLVRRTLHLLEHDRALQTAIDVTRMQAEVFAGVAGAAFQFAIAAGHSAAAVSSRSLRRFVTTSKEH